MLFSRQDSLLKHHPEGAGEGCKFKVCVELVFSQGCCCISSQLLVEELCVVHAHVCTRVCTHAHAHTPVRSCRARKPHTAHYFLESSMKASFVENREVIYQVK